MTEAETVGLRVVSYNIHSQRDDARALASVVRGLDPDVLFVQEGPRRFRWRARMAHLAHDVGLVVAEGGLPALGNVIMTSLRVRVHESWSVHYPLTPGRHMRGIAIARCSVRRTPFALVGSHLSIDPAERPEQATALRAAISTVDEPVIIGGDWNEGPGGSAWRTVSDGLIDAAIAADLAERHTFSCASPNRRIDAIFVDPRLAVVGYDVVDTPDSRRASDHFPIVADLAVPVAAPV